MRDYLLEAGLQEILDEVRSGVERINRGLDRIERGENPRTIPELADLTAPVTCRMIECRARVFVATEKARRGSGAREPADLEVERVRIAEREWRSALLEWQATSAFERQALVIALVLAKERAWKEMQRVFDEPADRKVRPQAVDHDGDRVEVG